MSSSPNSHIYSRLKDILATLYPNPIDAQRIAEESSLDSRRINFVTSVINIWHFIVDEAVKTEQIDSLFDVVLAEYGANQALQNIYNAYRESVATTVITGEHISASGCSALDTGIMRHDSPCYIVRDTDEDCLKYFLDNPATTVYVQGSRQMGKSSLIRRVVYILKEKRDIDTIIINFRKFSQQQLENEDKFFIGFCHFISKTLDLPTMVDGYWSDSYGTNASKCTDYMAKYIIPRVNKSFVLAMDEVETILGTPAQDDFFGMLRTWHDDRAWDETFAQLSLLLSSSTEPQFFIDNPHRSPFNVAQPVILQDFTRSEIEELNQRHPTPITNDVLDQLIDLLGGHPVLVRQALYQLTTGKDPNDLTTFLTNAPSDDGPFGRHLSYYWRHLLEMPELKRALLHICRGQTHPIDQNYYRLKGAGLVTQNNNQVVMRNKLYKQYFSKQLNV